LESKAFIFVMTIITFYALLGDDLRVLAFTKQVDYAFNILTIVSIISFIIEIVVTVVAKGDEYLFSFYFWLDVISTCSLFFDITFIWDEVAGVDDYDASSLTQLTRAGRGARAGTKAGRIVRIVRIIRLVRVGKLLKHSHAAFKAEEPKESIYPICPLD
jgi:hypothetical protein